MDHAANLVRGRCEACAKTYRIPASGGPFRCKACGKTIIPLEVQPEDELVPEPPAEDPAQASAPASTRVRGRRSAPQSIAGRGYVLLALLAACALGDVVAVWAGFSQRALLLRFEAGETIAPEVADANDTFYGNVGMAQLALYLATVIAWLVWLHRASKNQKPLGAHPTYSPGWAIGGWFVPFYNLWCPFQVTRELWKSSAVAAAKVAGNEHPRPPSSAIVVAWWLSWIAANIFSTSAGRRMKAGALDDLLDATNAMTFSDVLSFSSAVLAALVVALITRRQQAAIDGA